MQPDLHANLGAVTRTVSEVERAGKPARDVTLERIYATTAEDLWDAVTNPDRIPRWFLPISGELNVGGRYHLEGNASGTITECEPPRYLAATWEFGGGVSWIEVAVTPEGNGRARLTLSHICPVDDHWEQFGPGAVGVGWDLGLLGLEAHVSSDGHDHLDEEALAASDEGKAFIAGASDDWRRAAVSAGEDPARAKAAAKATTAFYTGQDLQED